MPPPLDSGGIRASCAASSSTTSPRGDADLVALYERLRHLEDAVRTAVRPERNLP